MDLTKTNIADKEIETQGVSVQPNKALASVTIIKVIVANLVMCGLLYLIYTVF